MRLFKISLILLLTLFTGELFAQPGFGDPGEPAPERLETLRVWKLTEYLDLSQEQATTFFPVLHAHKEELRSLDSTERAIQDEIAERVESGGVEQQFVNEKLQEIQEIQENQLEKEHEFMRSLPEYLTPRQQAKYLIFDRHFHRMLRKAMEQHRFQPKRK